jgi:hypothetical protein
MLAFQPLASAQASSLDMQLAHKIHAYLGMPFHFNSALLTLPVHLRGFGFPSIARLNSALAVSGLQRDLNHHIPVFRNVAQITLADWTCQINRCIPPLTVSSSSLDFARQKSHLPSSWLTAHKVMKTVGLSFLATNRSELLAGTISLTHLFNLTRSILPHPGVSRRLLTNFLHHGFTHLHHVGRWTFSPASLLPTSFSPFPLAFPNHQWTLTRDWPLLSSWLLTLPFALPTLSNPNPLLLLSRPTCQSLAESTILHLSTLPDFTYQHPAPSHLFASDGSSSTSRTGCPQVAFATFGNGRAFSLSLHSFQRSANILLAKVYGIVCQLLLARDSGPMLPEKPILLSDHLNSMNLLNNRSKLTPHQLFLHPAQSLYRWILNILSNGFSAGTDAVVQRPAVGEDVVDPPVPSSSSLPSIISSTTSLHNVHQNTVSVVKDVRGKVQRCLM